MRVSCGSRQFQCQRRQLTIGETTTGDVAMNRVVHCYALVALLPFTCVARQPAFAQQPESADFVLQGGKVFTLDAKDTVAQAVVTRRGEIVFVGSDAEARQYIGPTTKVYQAEGRTVIPGLNETHV